MKLSQLKQIITDNQYSENFLIFKCPDTKFLANQYIDAICDATGQLKTYIESVFEPVTSALSLVYDFSCRLNVVDVDEFDEHIEDFTQLVNTIVICRSINKKVASEVADYVVEFPKPEDWAVLEFMKVLCSGLSETEYAWLYENTKHDLYRISNELAKLNSFPVEERHEVLTAEKYSATTDLCKLSIFDLVEAIVKRKLDIIDYWALHKNMIRFYDDENKGQEEGAKIALVNLLLKTYKNLLYVNHQCGRTIETLELSKGQAWHLSNDYPKYTVTELFKIIDFLSGLDLRLKENRLDLQKIDFIDYIICHIFS